MILTDARRPARTGSVGELIPLAEQDRSRWDRDLITEGVALAVDAFARPPLGEYQLQAAIAALHDEAERPEDTDWPQILALYDLLEHLSGNPMVTLDTQLAGHYRLDAVRGHLFEMLGDPKAAAEHYRAAARRTTSLPEQHYLTTQAARLSRVGRRQAQEHPVLPV